MAENQKSFRNFIIAAGIIVAMVSGIAMFFITSGQKNNSFMVGYWGYLDDYGIRKPCAEELFEITKDNKFYPWKYEKKWGGHGRDPDITSTSYSLNDKNEITIKKFRQRRNVGGITGVVERISDSKVKFRNVIGTQLGIFEESGRSEFILVRCDEEITKKLAK